MKVRVSWTLPADLTAEASAFAAGDYVLVQKSGAEEVSKIDASFIRTTAHFTTFNPAALGAAEKGTSDLMSRGDHVHPTTGLMTTSHLANSISGWDTVPVALGASASAGNATSISRSNHVHPRPTPADIGAMATTHLANTISGWDTVPVALGASASAGDATSISRSNHVHPTTGLMKSTSDNYYFASDTDTGVAYNSGNVGFIKDGNLIAAVTGLGIGPGADNFKDCGWVDYAWNDVRSYGFVNASDEKLKTDIADSDLGLAFVDNLRPVKYRWKVGRRSYIGKGKDGVEEYTERPGVRFHYGLLGGQVAEALNGTDFAGYLCDAATGEQALRYHEFIAPIVKAMQELHGQIQEERQSRLALEQRLAVLEMALMPIGLKQAKG
jgi:hypothetical protein